jgi:trans-aconitate methyltransferase
VRRQGQRAGRFCGVAAGDAAQALVQIFPEDAKTVFLSRPAEYEKWLPRFGFKTHTVKLSPKDAVYQGRDRFAAWFRTTWLPYTQRVPENLREEFIAGVVDRYLAKHPPDAEGRVRVRMVRLEIDAVKNLS